MSSGRQTKTIEFTPPEVDGVADALRTLREAGSGWVNLMPGINEDAEDLHPRAGLFAFFGNQAAPVTMTTVMPPKKDRRDTEGLTVGIMHPTGGKAVARLAEAGVTLPEGGPYARTMPVAACSCELRWWSARPTSSPGACAPEPPCAGRR